jgi:glycosyltransferase involved in cell wall biosynthesis
MRAAGRLERFVVSRCDRIVFVAAGNRDEFARHYGQAVAAKFEVVPNGCDPAEFDAIGTPPVDRGGPFVLLHAGSLYAGRRSPRPLFDAVAAAIDRGLIDPRRFRLRFLGADAPPGLHLPAALAPVVEFLPRVPREQSLKAMMSASALLLLQPGHTVSVPGKVYEYLAAGRPILAIAEEGEISSLIRRAGAGISVVPADAAAIADALALLTGADCPPPSIRREHYDGTIGAARIADLLDAVTRPSSILTVECANDACQ